MQKGRIEVITGPMFSGKTTELFLRVQRYVFAGYKPLIIKYANDTRYNKGTDKRTLARSHDQHTMVAVSVAKDGLSHKLYGLSQATVIGVDEGQFFNGLAEFCDAMASLGKIVVVAGLSSTFERLPFPEMSLLGAVADDSVMLTGICVLCKSPSAFTRKIRQPVQGEPLEDIGGSDKYVSCCRHCFEKPLSEEAIQHMKEAVDIIKELRQK